MPQLRAASFSAAAAAGALSVHFNKLLASTQSNALSAAKQTVRALFAGYTEKLHNSSMQFQSIKLMENAQARTRLKIKNNMFKLLLIAIEQRCVKSKSIRFPQSIFE